jgi:predicted transposase YbfD/YdcC
MIISILAIICGADGWTDVELFGQSKEGWLRKFLELPNGIPSHDTFGRVFARLDAQEFQECFINWVQATHELATGQVIALDGKCLRGTGDGYLGKQAFYMVSAWATKDHFVLGQLRVDEKSNEITAVPELLKQLEIKGCIVTTDALNSQKKLAKQIIQQDADYVLALKDNHRRTFEDVRMVFDWAERGDYAELTCDRHQTIGKAHGRVETRTCTTISDPDCVEMLSDHQAWADLQTLIRVQSKRQVGEEISKEVRYYLSSLPANTPNLAAQALDATRSHWGIENQLHWVLDVSFNEDHCRVRAGNAAENLAVLRHFALNLIRKENSTRLSIRAKRFKAALDTDYLLKILAP